MDPNTLCTVVPMSAPKQAFSIRKTILWEVGFLVFVVGCGGERTYPVKGQVLLADGRPVTAGQIEFRAKDRPVSAIGFIQPDGTFELSFRRAADGAVPGTYTAALVEPPPPPGLGSGAEEISMDKVRSQWLADVPTKYRSMDSSGLMFEVKPDAQANDFKIVLQP
jgi:hypothetical protein